MKRLFTIAICQLLIANCFAQGFNWQWWHNSTGGAPHSDILANAIATDKSGNVYVAGSFYDSLSFDPYSLTNLASLDQFYLVKFDSAGSVQWLKGTTGQLPGFTASTVSGIATDNAGNAYVTGNYLGGIIIGPDTLPTVSNDALFTLKYNGAGNLLWAKAVGGTGPPGDLGAAIATDVQSNVYVGGYFNSDTFYFGSSVLVKGPNETAFLAKYDNAGNPLWAKAPVADGQCQVTGVATDAAGNIYCTGLYYSSYIQFGTTTLYNDSTGFSDIFTVKYDPSGNVIWAKAGHGVNHDAAYGITALANGETYIIGAAQSDTLTFGSLALVDQYANQGNPDLFVLKYDASGNVLWGKNTTGINAAVGTAIIADAAGNIYCTGWAIGSLTIGSDNVPVTSGVRNFLAFLTFDASGNLLCNELAGQGGVANGGVSVDPFGNAYIASSYYGPIVIGPDTLTPHDTVNNEAFIAKFNCPAAHINGIVEHQLQPAINVYPNPTNNKWQLAVDNDLIGAAFQIWDNAGRMIYESKIESISTEINLPGISQGLYLIRVGNDQFSITRKLVKL